MAKPKKNKYLNKATSQKAAELIREGNYRTAARLIGHRIDPKAPLSAGAKAMPKKTRANAGRTYFLSRENARVSGKMAGRKIAIARKAAQSIRRIDHAEPHYLTQRAKVGHSNVLKRNLFSANTDISLGKLARSRSRAAGIFGIAALFAQHLGQDKKKRG